MEYKIRKGECSQFAVLDNNFNSGCKEMSIGASVRFNYNIEGRTLRCIAGAEITQESRMLVKAECSMYFELSEDSVRELTRDGQIVIDPSVLVQFASLCYGALRGILIDRGGDIPFAIPVLPPVYLGQVITEPMRVSLNQNKE